jgi:hypothetical protein
MPIHIPRVTLDTNCLIDLAEHRPSEASVRQLVQANGSALLLQIPGIGASERLPGGGRRANFAGFMELLRDLQLESAVILKPMGYLGVCYYDWCVYSDDAMTTAEQRIHEVLFPNIEFCYVDFCAKRGIDPSAEPTDDRWLNAKCDVQGLWCHINEGGGLFVTSDGNFHKASKKPALEALGAGRIASPDDSVRLVGL